MCIAIAWPLINCLLLITMVTCILNVIIFGIQINFNSVAGQFMKKGINIDSKKGMLVYLDG